MSSAHERFWAKVNIQPGPGCWLWLGKPDASGAGRFYVSGVSLRPAHWAYMKAHGQLPKRTRLEPICGEPACVRPSHMVFVPR